MKSLNASEIRDLFQSHLKVDLNLTGNTIDAYDRDLEQFLTWCSNSRRNPFGIRSDDVIKYLVGLRIGEQSPATIARKLSTLKHFYKFGVQEGLFETNPCAVIEGPRLMRKLPRILDQNEMKRLLEAPGRDTPLAIRDSAILELWYACGLRVSEIRSLSVSDVIMETRLLRVSGKGRKERLVPFGSFAADAVQLYIDIARPALSRAKAGPVLFLNNRGEQLSRMGLWKILKRHADKCNFRFQITPHTIRHSCATHMIEAGADIRVVMEFLGHADISTTQIYTHLDREYIREVHKSYHPRA
jgi:integrase/recombinase XerD